MALKLQRQGFLKENLKYFLFRQVMWTNEGHTASYDFSGLNTELKMARE